MAQGVTEKLIHLISELCSFSISPFNLTSLLRLATDFRQYAPAILTSLSRMPRLPSPAQHFFEFYEFGSGLTSDDLSASSNGLSFNGWLCLDPIPFQSKSPRRRCVLSLLDKDFRGFEIFISEQNLLVASHITKDECFTLECPKLIIDSNWHSVTVSWSPPSWASTTKCEIFIDGIKFAEVRHPFSSPNKMKIRIGQGQNLF